MSCNPCQQHPIQCPNRFGCPPDVCPSFEIKRHDTKPAFSVSVEDCDGPIDLKDVIVEVSMWANAKLRHHLRAEDTYFGLADDIGFEQVLTGDIIVMNRVRLPEQMLVVGFDEERKLIQVQRGYHGSPITSYRKGCKMKIVRVLNQFGETKMVHEEANSIENGIVPNYSNIIPDYRPKNDFHYPAADCHHDHHDRGYQKPEIPVDPFSPAAAKIEDRNALKKHHPRDHSYRSYNDYDQVLVESRIIYNWQPLDTCVPGCYWLEFKLLKMFLLEEESFGYSPPSFVSVTPSQAGCYLGQGVEWERRIPTEGEGFLIKIFDSPSSELLYQ